MGSKVGPNVPTNHTHKENTHKTHTHTKSEWIVFQIYVLSVAANLCGSPLTNDLLLVIGSGQLVLASTICVCVCVCVCVCTLCL
jgi:hypothetical protein